MLELENLNGSLSAKAFRGEMVIPLLRGARRAGWFSKSPETTGWFLKSPETTVYDKNGGIPFTNKTQFSYFAMG